MPTGEGTVRFGAGIAVAAGVLLLIAMSALDWYGVEEGPVTLSANAWEAYNLIDYGLIAMAAIGIVFGLLGLARPGENVGVAGFLTAAAGVVAFVVIAIRAVSPADFEFRGRSLKDAGVDISTEIGTFVGLALIAAIAVGGLVAMRASGASVGATLKRIASPPAEGEESR